MSVAVSIYAIMRCAEYGHVRTGVSDSTDTSRTAWADYCYRCFADLRGKSDEREGAAPDF